MQHIALLGLGSMGSGMAANWLQKGFPLTICNRTRSRAGEFAGRAIVVDTPREAAANADVIVAMVADDQASRDVWFGEHGALSGAKAGAILIEASTLSPRWVRELATAARDRRCGFLDAPVGGSKKAAAAGQLTFFVGGEVATLDAVRPVLDAVSARINHLGGTGRGATWKLINNMMIATQVAALAEALALAERAGFDLRQAASLIEGSSAASPIVKAQAARIVERDYERPDFALRLMHKDARYVAAVASELGVWLEIAGAGRAAYARAEAMGFGDLDFAAVALRKTP